MNSSKCCLCRKPSSSLKEDMLNHIEAYPVEVYKYVIFMMEVHSNAIKSVQCCTELCEKKVRPPCKRLKRALITLWVLFCNTFVLIFFGVIPGAAYIFFCFPFLLVFYTLSYSPYFSLHCFIFRKLLQVLLVLFFKPRAMKPFPALFQTCCFFSFLFLFVILWLSSIILLTVACFIESLSCRFIGSVFGFLVMGLVLNADIASPFVTFFLVATTNLYLCYYNFQKRYQEVKEMIAKLWQKHKPPELDTNINASNSGQDAIPDGLFWYVCGEILPITREICRMLLNMSIILTFLILALCSVKFFGNTYNVSTAASTIAVFVSGVIPGLFFKGLTKEKIFTGAEKHHMMDGIEKAIKSYAEIAPNSGAVGLSPNRVHVV